MNEKLKNLKDKVEAIIEDLATLEVASFTGTVDLGDATAAKDIFAKIKTSLPKGTLVGYSRFEIEGDAMNYLNSDLGKDKKYLLDGHSSLVEGAQKSRKDFFDFVFEVINVK